MNSLGQFLRLYFPFTVAVLGLRIVEAWLVLSRAGLEDGIGAAYVLGGIYDLALVSLLGLLLWTGFRALSRLSEPVARATVAVVLALFLIGETVLVGYFNHGLIPLGADVLSYSAEHIVQTVRASQGTITNSEKFLLFLPVVAFGVGSLFMRRVNLDFSDNPDQWMGSLVVVGLVIVLGIHPSPGDFESETHYYTRTNKLTYFIGDIGNHLSRNYFGSDYTQIEQVSSNLPQSIETYQSWQIDADYPLYREAQYRDVLSEYIKKAERPPNIVIIGICGLGGSFIAPNASYDQFTPHLDALAKKGLYWPHFLSTSARSFGYFPSILGSLPYGPGGFMEMGYRMPAHRTLVSILNQNGYFTGLYYGSNASFDNRDIFLERQNIDLVMDKGKFSEKYERMEPPEGLSWGYSDHDMFRQAMSYIDEVDKNRPRLDIYFTLNLHSPFYIPNRARFDDDLDRIIESEPDSDRKQLYRQNREVFIALLYTDWVVDQAIKRYRQRADFENTIFIITGDHRIAPIPHRNRLSRYYVPFIVYSPLIKRPERFDAVSSHLDVAPTLLGHLESNYDLDMPEQVHWMGTYIDTQKAFRVKRELPFVRGKGKLIDYLAGDAYLSNNQLFRVHDGMYLSRESSPSMLTGLQTRLKQFRRLNQHVTAKNRLMPPTSAQEAQISEQQRVLERENNVLEEYGLTDASPVEQFRAAQKIAWSDNHEDAKIILRRVERERPDDPDPGIMLAKVHAWQEDYEEAERRLLDLEKVHPDYLPLHRAVADIYFWWGKPEQSIEYLGDVLAREPDNAELLYLLARSHNQADNGRKAREALDKALEIDPNHELADKLKKWIF